MPTPLYDALTAFAHTRPLRLHMPGHKGKPLAAPELAGVSSLDFTELGPTGNLYEPGPPMDAAQELWARACAFDWCQFLTGGSTQGIHTALALSCPLGSAVLIDRGSHRSVFNAMALLDLRPRFLTRSWLDQDGITGPISPERVEKALSDHPEIKTVCITSPTYYGVLSDIPAIAHIVHRYGGRLIIDGAHGLHLPFLGGEPFSGADLVVASAHKTLPALGQSAVLLGRGPLRDRARTMASVYGTSSPSYPVMASLDLARDWMEGPGREGYRRVIARAAQLRQRYPGLVYGGGLDPARLVIAAPDGVRAAQALEEMGIWPEMSDSGHVVFILTGCDSEEDLDRLESGLTALLPLLGPPAPVPPPPMPRQVMTPRQALFSTSHRRPLDDCLGQVAACQLAPYPPGVPVVAPGEEIGKKELSYLHQIGYNNMDVAVIG